MNRLCVTTSWDDGHPLDLRLAELLAKHGLEATFYVPRAAEHPLLQAARIRELGQRFEIGGHTLHNVDLTTLDEATAREEIGGSRRWLEDTTGKACTMFCFPRGRYRHRHLSYLEEAGFTGARTTEMLSLDFPRLVGGLRLAPITLQAYPQPAGAYLRNAVKRAAFRNLWTLLTCGRSTDWVRLAEVLAERATRRGGVFHLFGHSWEIDRYDLWSRLDDVFDLLRRLDGGMPSSVYCTNGQVCAMVPSPDGMRNVPRTSA